MAAKTYFSSTRIAMIALFSALAALLYIFNFALPFAFPAFLEFRFSDVPVLIGTFALGPLSGCVIVVMMVLIKLVCVSTSTMFVGDAADILVGFALVIPAGLIYGRHRTFRGALLSLAAGSVFSTALAVLLNRFALVPAYVVLMFGGSWEPILGMMTPLFPSCTQQNFYALYLWAAVINRLNAKLTPKKQAEGDGSRRLHTALILLGFALVILILVFFALLHYALTA